MIGRELSGMEQALAGRRRRRLSCRRARQSHIVIERRNLSQRAAALSRLIITMISRRNEGISELALSDATGLPDGAVRRILRHLAFRSLVRRLNSHRWAVAAFVGLRDELEACADDL